MRVSIPITTLHERFMRWATLRESQPVFHDPASNRWYVSRYDDVLRVLTDPVGFAPQLGAAGSIALPALHADQHRRRDLHAAIVNAVPAQAIATIGPRIATTTQQLIAQHYHRGGMDVIADLATPLVTDVFATLLDVTAAQRAQVQEFIDHTIWADLTLSGEVWGAPNAGAQDATEELREVLLSLVTVRHQQLHNDFLGRMVRTGIYGTPPTDDELVAACCSLLMLGAALLIRLIGNAGLCLIAHPGVIAHLQHAPPPVYSTIEEVLRYLPPVWFVPRTTTTEVVLRGHRIPAQAEVWAAIIAANHDPAQFVSPEQFDIERIPNRHVSFIWCEHSAIGAALTRQILSTVLLHLAALPNLHGTLQQPPEVTEGSLLVGVRSLPIAWTPTSPPEHPWLH